MDKNEDNLVYENLVRLESPDDSNGLVDGPHYIFVNTAHPKEDDEGIQEIIGPDLIYVDIDSVDAKTREALLRNKFYFQDDENVETSPPQLPIVDNLDNGNMIQVCRGESYVMHVRGQEESASASNVLSDDDFSNEPLHLTESPDQILYLPSENCEEEHSNQLLLIDSISQGVDEEVDLMPSEQIVQFHTDGSESDIVYAHIDDDSMNVPRQGVDFSTIDFSSELLTRYKSSSKSPIAETWGSDTEEDSINFKKRKRQKTHRRLPTLLRRRKVWPILPAEDKPNKVIDNNIITANNEDVQCTLCKTYTFDLAAHLKLHCDICNAYLRNPEILRLHKMSHTTAKSQCSCGICGLKFESSEMLRCHLQANKYHRKRSPSYPKKPPLRKYLHSESVQKDQPVESSDNPQDDTMLGLKIECN